MSTKTSINKQELEKFDKLSSQWWQEDGEFKILHQINPLRLSYIINILNNHFGIKDDEYSRSLDFRHKTDIAGSLLDVGCGGGLVTAGLCKYLHDINNFTITGIDAIGSNIEIARNYATEQNLPIKYFESTVEELIKNKSPPYDVVLCLEVIEHVEHVQDFIKNLSSLVKPDGVIIISTINRTLKAYMLAIFMAEHVLSWVKKGTHDYNKFLKPSEIYSMFNHNNIELKELKGLTFNILNNSWQLSDDIDVNYFAYLQPKKYYD